MKASTLILTGIIVVLALALIGVLLCNAAVYLGIRFVHNRQAQKLTS